MKKVLYPLFKEISFGGFHLKELLQTYSCPGSSKEFTFTAIFLFFNTVPSQQPRILKKKLF